MARHRRLHPIIFAAGAAGLLAGCAMLVGQPTTVPGPGRLDVPQPTATQIATGANPNPSTPRINQFAVQVNPLGMGHAANPYRWLEDVHSGRTRHWIFVENRMAANALAAMPQRAWIRTRLEQLEAGGHAGVADDVVVERAFYVASDGTRLRMEIATGAIWRAWQSTDSSPSSARRAGHRARCSSRSCWSGSRWGAYMRGRGAQQSRAGTRSGRDGHAARQAHRTQ